MREKERGERVSGFIFLRFICPAILAPKLFNIAPGTRGERESEEEGVGDSEGGRERGRERGG